MQWNPFKIRSERKQKEKEELARAGKTTSGYLSPGERQGMFRQRRKR